MLKENSICFLSLIPLIALSASLVTRAADGQTFYYGSLATSSSLGVYGVANNKPTSEAAKQAALDACGYPECKPMAVIGNGCLALAYGETGGRRMYSAFATLFDDLSGAERGAKRDCQVSLGGPCRIEDSFCTLETPMTDGPYIGVAYDRSTGVGAVGSKSETGKAAAQDSVRACVAEGGQFCAATLLSKSCVAVAKSASHLSWNYAHNGRTAAEASNQALDTCGQFACDCVIAASGCLFDGREGSPTNFRTR